MKHPLLPIAMVTLMAGAFAGQSSAQIPLPDTERAVVENLTAKTTPKRDMRRPYAFVTTGKIVPPARFCAAGENPSGTGGTNCVPILCPPGILDGNYCFSPSRARICSGFVAIRYQKVRATISSRNVTLKPDCTYRTRVVFRTLLRTRRGVLNVRARFQGNELLKPSTNVTHKVRAGRGR